MLYSFIDWESGKTLKENLKLDTETAYQLNKLLSLNLQPCRYVKQDKYISKITNKHIYSDSIKEIITKNNIYNNDTTTII
tara:strand:+ start:239 stop:478 length:240 start_codon:yes stop_codon:yes gene_type:complete